MRIIYPYSQTISKIALPGNDYRAVQKAIGGRIGVAYYGRRGDALHFIEDASGTVRARAGHDGLPDGSCPRHSTGSMSSQA